MLPLCQTSSREEARDFGLVLESQRIGYAVDEREGMFEISVSDYDLDEARDAIHLYIEENREASYRPDSFSQRFLT